MDEVLERVQMMNSESGFKNCHDNPHICGNEAACRSLDSETSKCVCPHDLSPPTEDLKCPNRLLLEGELNDLQFFIFFNFN